METELTLFGSCTSLTSASDQTVKNQAEPAAHKIEGESLADAHQRVSQVVCQSNPVRLFILNPYIIFIWQNTCLPLQSDLILCKDS